MSLPQRLQDFLTCVFGKDWAEKAILVMKTPDGRYRHMRAGLAKNLPDDTDLYWCIAAFPFGSDTTRTLERAENVRAFVIDDVGTKIEAEAIKALLGEPTRIVSTSRGNSQWVYRLAKPLHPDEYTSMRRMIGSMTGATDGMDAVHIFRLPQGKNTKPGRDGWLVGLDGLQDPGVSGQQFHPTGILDQFKDLNPAFHPKTSPETGKVRDIGALVKLIPNTIHTSRDEWVRTCHQIAALCEDETAGREAWEEYSGRWRGGVNTLEAVAKCWESVWGRVERTSGAELKARASAADEEGFETLQNREAAAVFDDEVDVAAETSELRAADGSEGYPPTHANMRDAVLRREKGWLGWLSNAPQRWAAFDGALGRWSIGETDAAMRTAVRKEIVARLRLPVDAKVAKEMSRAAWPLAVHALLKHHSMLEIPRHQFNADPDVLGVPRGALRFRSQVQVEDGRPDHMLSKTTRFCVGPRRVARPEWDRFVLEFASGDKSLVAWLQAFCGYCLTGHTMEHLMLFLYGPGGNGKSLFLDTIGAVMGDYHVRADHRLFMAKMGNFHLAPLASLEGARLVTVADVPHNATWDMGLVKLITGGGSITANYMRENPFSFFPECKLILAGNDKPRLESVDEGVRRRLRLVPCMNVPAAIDRGLTDKLLREGEGILRWILDGWELWSQFGLPACAIVEAATDEYLSASDVFGRWVKTEITVDASSEDKIRVGDLWNSWAAFRGREGSMRSYPNDQGSLSTRLREQKIGTWGGRDKHGAYFKGIRIRKVPEGVF